VIVKSKRDAGNITLKASTDGISTAQVTLVSK